MNRAQHDIAEYTTFGSCGFREEVLFSIYFHYMADNVAPVVWPVWTPEGRLAGLIKMRTIHCYTQSMKALGLVV